MKETELKEFSFYLESIGQRAGKNRALFNDFLIFVMCCLSMQEQEELYLQTAKFYSKDEMMLFSRAFAALTVEMEKREFTDVLGEYYNITFSNEVQHFTPDCMTKLITSLLIPADNETCCDPACGSGRFFLSSAKVNRNITFYGDDIDYYCCLMALINLCLYDLKGVISHKDTLSLEEWHRWEVKRHPLWNVPYIREIDISEEKEKNEVQVITEKLKTIEQPMLLFEETEERPEPPKAERPKPTAETPKIPDSIDPALRELLTKKNLFSMTALTPINNNKSTFDFANNKTEVLNLSMLKQTYKENDIHGRPLKEMYHYEVIDRVAEICNNSGLQWEIEEIFAAQNRNRDNPGVVILPEVEEIHGKNAIQAHVLRRIFTTIKIKDRETEELTTTIAIAYHQDGIQIGFGPCVKICHNQCILGKDRTASNFGKDAIKTEDLFTTVENWLNNFFEYRENDIRKLEKLKQIPCNQNDVFQLIGVFTALRVARDSENKDIGIGIKNVPLNQSQITKFTEAYLIKLLEKPVMSLWDIYNIATEIYKPIQTEIPNLIPQNVELMEVLTERYGL